VEIALHNKNIAQVVPWLIETAPGGNRSGGVFRSPCGSPKCFVAAHAASLAAARRFMHMYRGILPPRADSIPQREAYLFLLIAADVIVE